MSEVPPRLNLIQRAMQQAQARREGAPELANHAPQPLPEPMLRSKPEPSPKEELAPAARASHAAEVGINYAKFREARIPLPGEKNQVTFNEFRSVKRKLVPLATSPGRGRDKNIVMVSSALPGEGKTFSSVNLAIALAAEKNLSVILVDGDVIRCSLKEYFSGPSEKGLLDLFGSAPCKMGEVLHRCADLPNLHVLFSGSHNDSAPELFASARMVEICEALSKRFAPSIVLIDSPPILSTSEPASLAAHVDHLLMVVAAGRSNRYQVETALSAVSSCRNISLLFNKAPKWQLPAQGSYYYYPSPSA